MSERVYARALELADKLEKALEERNEARKKCFRLTEALKVIGGNDIRVAAVLRELEIE